MAPTAVACVAKKGLFQIASDLVARLMRRVFEMVRGKAIDDAAGADRT
jgi:hypothetical protein